MIDLNSTLFYKTNFVLQGDADVLWEVVIAVRSWLLSKYKSSGIIKESMPEWTHFKNDLTNRKISNDHRRLYVESCNHYGNQFKNRHWACRIIETIHTGDLGIAPRKWITDIGMNLISANRGELSFVVSYSDAAGYIGLCEPIPCISTHGVIRQLTNHRILDATLGDDHIIGVPNEQKVGDFSDFWMRILAEKRELPIVLISPEKVEEGQYVFQVSPLVIADALLGNAIV